VRRTDRLAEVDRLETERFSSATRLGWRFGGELELVGYDRRARGGRELEVTYYWKAERRMDRDYTASVRFDGPARFQIDYVPRRAGSSDANVGARGDRQSRRSG
jgi:hypothetical protein